MTNLWIEKESQLFWNLSQVHSHCTSTKITEFFNSPPLPEATHSQQPAAADPFLNQVAIGFHPLLPTPLMRSDTKPQKSTAGGMVVGSLKKKMLPENRHFPKTEVRKRSIYNQQYLQVARTSTHPLKKQTKLWNL